MTYINLLKEMAIADFKIRYKRSMLGFLWSFLKPLSMMLVLYFVFGVLLNIGTDNYVLYLLLGIIIWNFFVETTIVSMDSIMSKKNIIQKVPFPKEIIVLSAAMNALAVLLSNIAIFLVFLIAFNVLPGHKSLLFIPTIIPLLIFSIGAAYFLTALYVKFRDIYHIWNVVIQLGFWATPIIYTLQEIPGKYLGIYLMNPLATIINSSRELIINNAYPEMTYIIIATAISIAAYYIGKKVYEKQSQYFAEEL